jgi:hypothetical protein
MRGGSSFKDGNGKSNYEKNKDYYLKRNRRRKLEVHTWIRQYKETIPCKDCGKIYPHYVMDFDHLRDKTGTVSHMQTTLPRIKREIEKCELVCSNCHRIRTYNRRNKK